VLPVSPAALHLFEHPRLNESDVVHKFVDGVGWAHLPSLHVGTIELPVVIYDFGVVVVLLFVVELNQSDLLSLFFTGPVQTELYQVQLRINLFGRARVPGFVDELVFETLGLLYQIGECAAVVFIVCLKH